MNIEKILILSDFSGVSTPLIKYGTALAQHLNARVWVQHAYALPPNPAGEMYVPTDTLEHYEGDIGNAFDTLKEKIPALEERKAQLLVSNGDLVPEMNKLIDREHIDLVVVGNQGGGFLTNILGSNTIKVIQHAHCPVLSVPVETVFKPFRRIALTVDLKETKPALIDLTVDFAKAFQARVDIVHVSEAPVPVDVKQLAHRLDKALQTVSHHFFHIQATDVEQGIEQHVEGNNNDLLVLLPRVHSFFDRLFQKSISRQAAYQERVPLLTIRAEQDGKAG